MSDKLSSQKPLTKPEVDVLFIWLKVLFDFFAAVDPETGQSCGVPLNILRSAKYDDLQSLRKIYFYETGDLIQKSEMTAEASARWHQETNGGAASASVYGPPPPIRSNDGLLLPPGGAPHTHALGGPGKSGGLLGAGLGRRKTVMMTRNMGTMRKAKEEKRKQMMSEPRDDNVLRVLRMRPEAARYLGERARQKQRLAAHQAAQAIVRESLKGFRQF
jgi:hypothetical protein